MKKVLSWVLVLALVLSSFTMAFAGDTANSSDMKDAAAIKNVEAVDVMVATGIIGGYPDGYYYPEKAVTRAEMAKMISVAVNGGEDVGAYYANSCTFADSVNHWAAGYIAYCANEGIIDGRDANTFDPDANVTGVEAAKMMLVALGYDSKIEKLTGDQWAANVLKLAKANELFDGCDDFNAGAALNRDNAAQIIFNGLKAEMVEYLFDAEISTGDTTVTVNTKVNPIGELLYEVAFDGDLYPGRADSDDFGRPAHEWVYDKDSIGVYANEADYTFVSTVGTDDANDQILDAVEAYDADLAELFEDGDYVFTTYTENGDTMAYDPTYFLDEGVIVELYEMDDEATDAVEYEIVTIWATVEDIEAVDTVVSDADAEDGISAYVTIDGTEYNDTDIPGYDADTYVEEAVIAVVWNWGSGDAILDTFVPEKVTGEVTKFEFSAKANNIYLDGEGYPAADYGYYAVDGETLAVENSYDLYLVEGYVYGSVLVEETTDTLYGVFLDAGYEEDAYGNDTVYAKIFTAEGAEAEYVVDSDYAGYRAPADNTLVAYTLNEDGELDSIEAATEAVTAAEEKSVSANGIFDGKLVDDSVVVFNDDNNDVDDPAWAVYGYDEFAAAEDGIACTYIVNDDGDIIAVYTTDESLISRTTTVIGFYLGEDYDVYTEDADGDYYTMSYMVNGATKTYTTINWSDVTGSVSWNVGDIHVLTLNADGEITAMADPSFDVGTPTDDFGAYDGIYNEKADIVAVKGNNINVGTEATPDLQYVGSAVVYTINADGEFVKSSLSKIKAGYDVYFFQLDEASEAWDAIVWAE